METNQEPIEEAMMELYCGIDLHSTNSYVVILEGERALFQGRLANDLGEIVRVLAPFADRLSGVVVESTYNWYWLVDGLIAAGYRVHLANQAAIQQYEGLKDGDDRWPPGERLANSRHANGQPTT